ncbi:hypothetical protein CBFG_01395 [Clostridiales bacterium 1_7_47FAA]|nr:hypothetical protein CBFG_01395 [Clostridiales bacterium 1_7_47FAA]
MTLLLKQSNLRCMDYMICLSHQMRWLLLLGTCILGMERTCLMAGLFIGEIPRGVNG